MNHSSLRIQVIPITHKGAARREGAPPGSNDLWLIGIRGTDIVVRRAGSVYQGQKGAEPSEAAACCLPEEAAKLVWSLA
jgi:hypothetical protein